ncbi:hypothetical protein SEA_NANCIA_20 [Arthrobacter phage Nancia]|uniref:Uncharacterized protein n=13 Tax=Korravirus drrobert TaxID=1982078 RepID=A0A222ZFB0_9CAUD|nr:hol-like chemotaxis [Arthrobacter phage DrRobert]AOQ28294.1 hypothetical protein SEA_LUCY_20 [Arthrobacter phage Lucy]ASR83404.1 hypothetical protein SEA_CHRISTIAN_20 [Arthrobacter phage Christian]ASR83815.1 hypothetical protein SEA_PITADOG_20 [Arthrobacter phage PitaDog]AZF98276.1 hypothetical protein SEA_BODACIOUS_20 [Arthrobacter phage Bodacious]AZS07003.1 hypothetical protein SEA_CHEWCHEW_20 [Arthrobacter phage ChewChew]AZS07228.1 hypothetical protein SEA_CRISTINAYANG_20 [Arthrobacter 
MTDLSAPIFDVIKTAVTVLGSGAAMWLVARLTRKSQQESSQINLLTNLIDQLQEERNEAKKQAAQIPLWRRYSQSLRGQVYRLSEQVSRLGETPVEAAPIEPTEGLEL